MVLVFASGALAVVTVSALARAALTAGFEPRGHRLDRWRRVWFHPERELGQLLESLLILAFVWNFTGRFQLPAWSAWLVFLVWALHLPADGRSWIGFQRQRSAPRQLHRRGFLLLELGPLWLRVLLAGLAAGLYGLLPPVQSVLDTIMALLLGSLQNWLG